MDTQRRESLTRKHLAERRRRAKINYYLDEIETLISPPCAQINAVKMEKAELLEKTVAYLRHIKSKGLDTAHRFQYQQPTVVSSQNHMRLSPMAVRSPFHFVHAQNSNPLNLETKPTNLGMDHQQCQEVKQPEVNNMVQRSRSLSTQKPSTDGRTHSDSPDIQSRNIADPVSEDHPKTDCSNFAETEVVVKKEMETDDLMLTFESVQAKSSAVWRPWAKTS